jgi:uncharacterized membrane protein
MERLERVDFLTDGVFAIVATLLVLELHVPEIPANHTSAELLHSLTAVAPSFVAFVFSFVSILVYWVNHATLGRRLERDTYRLVWSNLIFLMWISLIPFTTKFIAEYPTELVAVLAYGVLALITAVHGMLMYCYVAFWARPDLMSAEVTQAARERLLKKWSVGPVLYAIAIVAAFASTWIAVAIFILVPAFFFVPALQERVLEDLHEEPAPAR